MEMYGPLHFLAAFLLGLWSFKYSEEEGTGLFIILLPTSVDQVTECHLPEYSNLQDILYILSDIVLYLMYVCPCIVL